MTLRLGIFGLWTSVSAILLAACAIGDPEDSTENDDQDGAVLEVEEPLEWTAGVGASKRADLTIANGGAVPLDIEITDTPPWLAVDDADATVEPGDEVDVDVDLECPDDEGDYEGILTVESNDRGESQRDVEAILSCEVITPAQLEVVVDGLSDGVDADIDVQGPDDFSRHVTATTTIEEAAPGSYEFVAAEVGDSAVYVPQPESTSKTVEGGDDVQVSFEYDAEPGDLEVVVEGLGDDADPQLEVVREGDSWPVPDDGLIEGLLPGLYTVMPEAYEDETGVWVASEVDVQVASREVNTAEVEYLQDTGALEVQVQGLPDGVFHDIDVVGDDDSRDLPQSGVLAALEQGSYDLEPRPVSDGPAVYEADAKSVTIETGQTTKATVEYDVVAGQLPIEIEGLDTDEPADITLVGDEHTEQFTTADTYDLMPDDYTVVVADVEDGTTTFVDDDTVDDIVVESGQNDPLVVSYAKQPADIDVVVTTHQPMDFELSLEGQGSAESFDDDASFEVEPGTYEITASGLPEDSLGNQAYARIEPADIEVGSGDWQTVDVDVAPGHLVVSEADDGPGSLRDVVSSVVDDTTVEFAASVDSIGLTGGTIDVERSIAIDGGDESVVVEGGAGGIFEVGATERVEFGELTLTGGQANEGGALAVGTGAEVELKGVVFDDNDADDVGGAVYVGSGADVEATNVKWKENESGAAGGAVFVDEHGVFDVNRAVFESNVAAGHGGAVATFRTLSPDVTTEIEAALFVDNFAAGDSGAFDVSGVSAVSESTFVDNEAASRGGAIRFWDGELTLLGSTITENQADHGGGIEHWGAGDTHLELGRSIVAANEALESGMDIERFSNTGQVITLGHNVVGTDVDGLEDGQQGDQVGTESDPLEPEIDELADNGGFSETMAPELSSPAYASVDAEACVDMADGSVPMADQRGVYRPAGAYCHAGAYEAQATVEDLGDADMALGQYEDGSFDGVDGIQWHYEEVRRQIAGQNSYHIGETSVMLHGDRDSRLWAEDVPGGVDSISVLLSQGFTADGTRTVDLYVDGDYVDTSPDVTIDTDEQDAPYPVFVFAVDELDTGSEFDVEILASGSHQVVVDKISWK